MKLIKRVERGKPIKIGCSFKIKREAPKNKKDKVVALTKEINSSVLT